jgi:hypothetical protein
MMFLKNVKNSLQGMILDLMGYRACLRTRQKPKTGVALQIMMSKKPK